MGLRLFFFPNFPGATFILGGTLFQALEYIIDTYIIIIDFFSVEICT